MIRVKNCRECVYVIIAEDGQGFCHFNPPQVFRLPMPEDRLQLASHYPPVLLDDPAFPCGRGEPRR